MRLQSHDNVDEAQEEEDDQQQEQPIFQQAVSPGDKFKVEISGGNIVQSASNVANTMFAERLTKSILSDETIEQ